MPEQQRQFEEPAPAGVPGAPAAGIDRFVRFEGPPEEFLVHMLRLQCEMTPAECGAVLRAASGGAVQAVAVYPEPADRS